MEDDGDDKDDSKRRTRNISEKKRRDQFNFLVNELSTMVSGSNRKMDKSTVLKSTISFLKNHNEITVRSRVDDVQEDWKPAFLSNVEFTYFVLEALEGFVMVFSVSGRIHYVSESITSLLGYNVGDLLNKSIFDLTFEEDRPNLYHLLQNPRISTDPMQRDNEIRFQCHLRRGTLDFRDESTYELIDFNGHFRANTEHHDSEEMSYQHGHESRLLFVCTGRLSSPQLIRDVSLADSSRSEFTSRHSLEWKFLFLDHRAPPIIGYLPFEVLGTSGYDYYHFDDLEKIVSCHESLMQKGELTSCHYRFLTKGQQWIWLQTRYYITYHQWNSKPEFVVCTHRVVNEADVARSAKQEVVEAGASGDGAQASTVKELADDTMSVMSPSYMSDASDAFAHSYQALSQEGRRASVLSGSAASTICTEATAGSAWRYAAASDTASRYQPGSDTASRYQPGSDTASRYQPGSDTASRYQPGSDTASRYQPGSDTASRYQPGSDTASRYHPGSDTASVSGSSRSSQRNSRDITPTATLHHYNKCDTTNVKRSKLESAGVPQWSLTSHLEPAPYVASDVGAVALGAITAVGTIGTIPVPAVQSVLSLPSMPILVAPDQAQIQEQLQQKHEELQQMIERQQEELRQVKEQLLLARLGILQPLPNVPNSYPGNEIEGAPHVPAELVYEEQTGRLLYPPYPPQPPPNPHLPQ